MLVPFLAKAEGGEKSVGLNLGYGTEEYFTIGGKFNWNMTDAIRLSPSIYGYFGDYNDNMFSVGLDVNYLFPVRERLTLYPLAGFAYVHGWGNHLGASLGGGVDYDLTSCLVLNGEAKYQLTKGFDQFVLAVGVAYKF